jgi:transposase-like protein
MYSGSQCEPRLHMLSLPRDNPTLTIQELAAQMECSERTVRRWWKTYQQGGLQALPGDDCSHAPKSSAPGRVRLHSLISVSARYAGMSIQSTANRG